MTDSASPPNEPAAEPARTADPFGLFGASLDASMEAVSAWSQTWQSLLEARGGPSAALMMGALADPAQWPNSATALMDEFRQALALPRFADLPAQDEGLVPSAETAVDLAVITQQCLAALVPAWTRACENFQTEIAARRARGETPDVLADGMDVWNGVLDRTLMEFNRSQDFAGLQQRMLRLAMRQRQERRRRAEALAEMADMPTRSEMLDIYARLHGLMREVHGLRRELKALKAEGVGRPEPQARGKPRNSPSRKSS